MFSQGLLDFSMDNFSKITPSNFLINNTWIFIRALDKESVYQSHYIAGSRAQGAFVWKKYEIRADLGPVGNTEKKCRQIMSNF